MLVYFFKYMESGLEMFKCKPERNPKQVTLIMLTCVTVFVLTAFVSLSVAAFKWLFELALIVIATVGIAVIYRYSMTEMEYEICDGSFSVIKIVGQKRTTACSLDLSTAIMLVPKDEFKEAVSSRALPYINQRFNFNQNLKCNSYVYVCEFNGKTIAVEFEPNQPFISVMLKEIEDRKKGGDSKSA